MAADIRKTRQLLAAIRAEVGGSILVALSGGKDSLVTLDLCVETFDHVETYYMAIIPGLQCVETPINAAVRRYGVKHHTIPHWDLARMLKWAVLRPHIAGAENMRELKERDCEEQMMAKTGIPVIAYGSRMTDTFMRRLMLRKHQGWDRKTNRIFPIYDWLPRDIYAYLRAKRIPVPHMFGANFLRGSGFCLEAETMRFIKANYPADYQKILRLFPFAEVPQKVEEFYGKAEVE